MNILIFNWRDITHPWAGGAERHIHELGKEWVKQGHNVAVVCGGYTGAVRRERIDGVDYRRIGNTYTVYMLTPFYYISRLRFRKFDVIIDTAHGIPFFTKLFTRRPVVLIIHHDHQKLWQSEWPGLISKVGRFLEKNIVPALYKHASVVTLSDSTRNELTSHGYTRVYAAPPGVDRFYFKNGAKKSDIPTILYLGRLRKYKRVDLLISLYPEIAGDVPEARLVIAGSGQDQGRIAHIIRTKHLDNRVEMLGYVSESEKRRLLQNSWILAFPSLMEGWGLVAMQAAACGTPTVGFRVSGVVDAVKNGESGILVKHKKEFVQAVVKLLSDQKLRERMSLNARAWARKFTWKQSAARFMEVIEREVSDRIKN